MAIIALVTKLQLDGELGIETPFFFANTPQGGTKKSTPRWILNLMTGFQEYSVNTVKRH